MLIGATFSSAINALIIVSDSLIAGLFLGENAVSAINLVSPAYNLCVFYVKAFICALLFVDYPGNELCDVGLS